MSYNFDKKIKIFISLAITVTTLCVLGISTFSSIKIVTEKSGSLAEIQMETLANDYQMSLSGYYDMAERQDSAGASGTGQTDHPQ